MGNNQKTITTIALTIAVLAVGFIIYAVFSPDEPTEPSPEIIALQKKITELENKKPEVVTKTVTIDNTKTVTNNSEIDLPSLIKKWQPYVPFIACTFIYTEDYSVIQSGSGLFIDKNFIGTNTVLTNKHILQQTPKGVDRIVGANYCDVIFPNFNLSIRVENSDMKSNPIRDMAFLNLPDSAEVKSLPLTKESSFCDFDATIGEKVLILGYPGIGSPTGITATEGIISGYDGIYYVTSAKIDHGNSGGVAILEKYGCNIGIPTEAVAGSLESLGRILDGRKAIEYKIN